MSGPGEPLEVLLCDNHLLAVAKPAGLPSVPDASGDASLLELAKAWIKRGFDKPGEVFLGVVHRLDRPVSGVVLFARTSKSAGRLAGQFRSGEARKRYLGVCERAPSVEMALLEQWLVKDEAANRVRIVAPESPGSRRARTRLQVLASLGDGHALVELEPQTGRPHQLRVALASLGAPLLGDLKYGARAPLPDASIALHAQRLEVRHPTLGEPVVVECAPPARPWWP